MTVTVRVVLPAVACLAILSCGRPEDPARVELRARLKQDARLHDEELKRFVDEVGRSVEGKTFRIKEGAATRELDEAQRAVTFGMLTSPAGIFDQGLRVEGGASCRLLNAPGEPLDTEIEATRVLCVDVETLLPSRFEFFYAVPGFGDYAFELVEGR